MASLPPEKISPPIQIEETKFKAAASEYTMERFGKLVNFLEAALQVNVEWKLNGSVSAFVNIPGVDGTWTAPINCAISDIIVDNGRVAGISGTTEFNIEVSRDNGATWTTILTTRPHIVPAAIAFASCGTGQTVTGFTAAVMSTTPFALNAGDKVRLIVTSAMGAATDGKVQLRIDPT